MYQVHLVFYPETAAEVVAITAHLPLSPDEIQVTTVTDQGTINAVRQSRTGTANSGMLA